MSNKLEIREHRRPNLMTQFTKEFLEERTKTLQDELTVKEKQMGGTIEKGDEYHDNFAYEEACRQVDLTRRLLFEVKQKLSNVVIIEPRQKVDLIHIGNTVVLRFAGETEDETFTVLGPSDANRKPGWISYESPLGSALLGKKAGDETEYQIPKEKSQQITIKKVLHGSF